MTRAKAKTVRETRVAYRARPVRPRARRAARPRAARQIAQPVISVSARQAATWQQSLRWQGWLNEHAREFEEKNPGQYLAIWDEQIIATGNTWGEAYKAATATRPDVIPLVTYIPRAEDVPFLLTPFPVEWVK